MQPFRYTGREWDAASGLYHYRARTYDSSTGRFLQEDPIGFLSGDLNLYRYGLSNPITFSDALGLTASGEYAGAGRTSSGVAGPAATIGSRISCVFTALAAGLELAGQPDIKTIDLVIVGTDVGMACGARGKPGKKKKPDDKPDGPTCPIQCFAAGTLVHTLDGLRPIEEIQPGDLVKSMDMVTGEIKLSIGS